MNRSGLAVILCFSAITASAGDIQYNYLGTFDTGIRLANGRWKLGAEVSMTYLNFLGEVAVGNWEAELRINDIHKTRDRSPTYQRVMTTAAHRSF